MIDLEDSSILKLLFTSVGRRVELVQSFKNAANKLNIELEIIGADINSLAPALQFCDNAVIVPSISDENYIPFLKNYCKSNGINALIPTIDTDLYILAQNKNSFGSTIVVVSSPHTIELCSDKVLTSDYFRFCNLLSPSITDNYSEYNDGFPAFIKPKNGSSSINAFKVESKTELELYSRIIPDYIVQPFIKGQEYTVDVYCNFKGIPLTIVPRKRLAVRAGEVLISRIDNNRVIVDECRTIVDNLHPMGAITIQLIHCFDDNKNYYIEINPRFGGGAPISIAAGANSAELLLKELCGESIDSFDYLLDDGATFSRFDQTVRIG